MSVRRSLAIACCAALALALSGCPPSPKSLGTTEESGEFLIAVVVRGENPSEWKLADDAGALASAVWSHQDELVRIGEKLRQAPSWSCKAAKRTLQARKIFGGLHTDIDEEERFQIERDSGLPEYEWDEVDQVIDDLLALSPLEAAKAVNAACSLRQF